VFDFATSDRRTIVQLKIFSGPPRGLPAHAVELALACRSPGVDRAIVAWWIPSFSTRDVQETWKALLEVFAPDLRKKLELVLASPSRDVINPRSDLGEKIAAALRTAAAVVADRPEAPRPDRSYEVLKILLLRWLRGDPPISVGELQHQTGLTHPTVSKRLRELDSYVERTSNRSVRLQEFPVRPWAELIALSPRVRQTAGFEDRSGRSGDLSALVARVQRQRYPNVAIGGVVGARFWQPEFDLIGTPRVDLEVHVPEGKVDLRFVSRLDPALAPARPEVAPILAIHVVTRASSLFTQYENGAQCADPIEILLDLHQLKLNKQADDFVRYWRQRS
jgi:hypothetical protein